MVFFPSFAYADVVYQRWVVTGIAQRIAKIKTVFREPRAAADVEVALRAFSLAVERGSRKRKREGEGMMTNQSVSGEGTTNQSVVPLVPGTTSTPQTPQTNQPTQTGAFMLCVCGGKLSEGINFKDELGRLVVMVGLPYANPEEPELKARMAYLDETGTGKQSGKKSVTAELVGHRVNTKSSRGRSYYDALCMRSVNQSVGRAIRHVGDFAAILFCDKRFAPARSTEQNSETNKPQKLTGVPSQLAHWIGERLQTPNGYGQTQSALARFFAQKRKEGR